MSAVRVYIVESATIHLQKKRPPCLLLRAEGKVNTSGWKNPELGFWVYVTPPADGIQDVDFVAEEPTGFVLQVVSDISAEKQLEDIDIDNYWGPGHPLKGFRIHAATNKVEVLIASANFI